MGKAVKFLVLIRSASRTTPSGRSGRARSAWPLSTPGSARARNSRTTGGPTRG